MWTNALNICDSPSKFAELWTFTSYRKPKGLSASARDTSGEASTGPTSALNKLFHLFYTCITHQHLLNSDSTSHSGESQRSACKMCLDWSRYLSAGSICRLQDDGGNHSNISPIYFPLLLLHVSLLSCDTFLRKKIGCIISEVYPDFKCFHE